MKVSRNDTLQYTRYYFGSYEVTEYAGGGYEKDTWLSAGGGAFGFHRETATTDSIYYLIKDHLGSVMAVAGEDGTAKEFFSYDAWGRRRNATDWTYDSTLTTQYTARGYTGHEHMDETCLINMNGRVYDPIVGLFLSPDPVIQEPMNPLNYNRYTYVLNNPLKYTDPSGYTYSNKRIEWENSWQEGMVMYYAMNQINADWMSRMSRRGGGGGGSGFDPRGWSYNESTQEFYNARTGEVVDARDPLAAFNYMGVDYEPLSSMGEAYEFLGYSRTVLGTDKYGSQEVLYENLETGALKIKKEPFWKITGSYYNQLYYFDGLVAFDTYTAQDAGYTSTGVGEGVTYRDIVMSDLPEPIMGMPPALGKSGGAKIIKSLRGIKLTDYIRTGRTTVSNQLIKGPGATGAVRTWAIKGGGENMRFHYHIHKYNWYKPWIWFKQTPIIKPPK